MQHRAKYDLTQSIWTIILGGVVVSVFIAVVIIVLIWYCKDREKQSLKRQRDVSTRIYIKSIFFQDSISLFSGNRKTVSIPCCEGSKIWKLFFKLEQQVRRLRVSEFNIFWILASNMTSNMASIIKFVEIMLI